MPFDPAPRRAPWLPSVEQETALRDLAAYVRQIPDGLWDYSVITAHTDLKPCGTIGCAIGHAPFVPSCAAIGLHYDAYGDVCNANGDLRGANLAFDIPENVYEAIFFGGTDPWGPGGSSYGGLQMEEVRQHMVADRIEHWLATGEIR